MTFLSQGAALAVMRLWVSAFQAGQCNEVSERLETWTQESASEGYAPVWFEERLEVASRGVPFSDMTA